METFSALLAICAGNSPVTGEFPAQRPVTRSFDVFFDLRLNERLSKQSWGCWFATPQRPLWHHCNDTDVMYSSMHQLQRRFNKTAVEIWVWMSNYILLVYVDAITYPCPNPDDPAVFRPRHFFTSEFYIVYYKSYHSNDVVLFVLKLCNNIPNKNI